MLRFRPLDPAIDSVDPAWTFPAYRHLLALEPATRFAEHGDPGEVRPVACVATEKDRAVALAVGCLPQESRDHDVPRGELLSLFVAPEHRGQGVGTRLVEEIEGEIRRAGYEVAETVYMTGSQWIDAVEGALRRRGWSTPEPRMLALRASLEEAFATPWFGRFELRDGFELFAWSEVGRDELERLRAADAEDPWIAEDLRPWTYDTSYMEPASSLGIRLDGELVGWLINHRVDDETLRVTCAFLRPDLSGRARILPALTESLRRARDAGFERVLFTVPIYHREMVRFTRRWCGPFATFLGETRCSHKRLRSEARNS